MVDLRPIYKEQLRLVKEIAEDIVKNNASPEVINHAKNYAHIENEYGEFWRINWGEAYAYVDINKKGKPTGNIWWNNDEMGIKHDGTYKGAMDDLDNMTPEELYNKSQYAENYEEDKVYDLIYEKYVAE